MRKIVIPVVIILVAVLVYLGYAQFSGGAVPTFGLPIGGEKAKVRHRVSTFFEDVKFKNIAGLKELVSSSVSQEGVLLYLEKGLGLGPNQDLSHVSIEGIELDKDEKRARVKVMLTGQDLATRKPFNIEKLLFLYAAENDRWLIDTAAYPNL